MENKEYNIKIVVTDISVDENYFDISFDVYIDGLLKTSTTCGGDHDWGKRYKDFEKCILNNPLSYIMENMDGDWD